MIDFDEAEKRFLALGNERGLGAERVGIDAAAGRVLAEDVTAPEDSPAFDYSAMDGYAVALASFGGAGPWTLPVVGESKTGALPADLVPGCACRIFTGAAIPAGADAVVMQERVTRSGDRAAFDAAPKRMANVRRRGEDLARGDVAVARGTRLRPAHLSVAATCDRAWMLVARRPLVTFLSTGDELRAPGTPGPRGSIAESNGVALRAMAERAGASGRIAPIVGDDRAATERAIAAALEGTDVLVTVGGVSVGEHDWVRPALEGVGVSLDFWKVAMKPGKPLVLGRRGRTVVIGLPGNPASAMITFALFGLPLLRAMQGDRAPVAPRRPAICGAPFRRNEAGRAEFVRVALRRGSAGESLAVPLTNQASGASSSLADADALLCVPAPATELAAGSPCEVIFLNELGA
ncbi:MAG TPA: gephyrin-like molybdotransferase Glp [Polyangiaceae bacterium]|jgi:molybdopterin molybdotransferase